MNIGKVLRYLKQGWQKKGLLGFKNLIQNYRVLRSEPEIVSAEILTAFIEPTVRCNLNCVTCSEVTRGRTKKDMDFSEFKNILDQFPYLIKLALQGVGEPLLNRDLFRMIRLAKERKIYVYFNSNGTLLNDEISDSLVQSGLDLIHFSIDGGTQEVYEKIRRGASFEDFRRRVKRFMEIKGSHALPETYAWFVLNQYNQEDIMPTLRLVGDLGISKLYIQRMHTWGRGDKQDVVSEERPLKLRERKKAVEKVSQEMGVSVEWLWDIEEEMPKRRCQAPWYTTYITVEGYVTPCCVHGSDPQLIHFGNLEEKSFKEIWSGGGYREFRKALKSNEPPFICRNCPAYSQGILT
jgi:MoaA/NifB/PqqE/SkfB family radical SAM enzyme